jgi:ribonuclease BN (tRNA processing enzyme)
MRGIRLTVLGSGTCELSAARSSPAYAAEAAGGLALLDLGAGALRRLTELGFDPARVQGVLLSHHHPDHLGDLLPLLFALNYDPALAGARLTLAGHHRLARVLDALGAAFGRLVQPGPERLAELWLEPGRTAEVGPFAVEAAPAAHLETSLAFRLEAAGASLVYLGDSEATGELAGLCRGAGLVIAHCAGSDAAPKPGHLSPTPAGRLAAKAGAGALLISHLYRAVDPVEAVAAARREFSGPVWAAADGMAVEVGPGGAELHKP